jgi:hypothetical protein
MAMSSRSPNPSRGLEGRSRTYAVNGASAPACSGSVYYPLPCLVVSALRAVFFAVVRRDRPRARRRAA